MRVAIFLTMALTPFILSAWASKTPARQKKSEDTSCRSPFHAAHVDVRHTESKGVGYNKGYTTLEWFGIYDHNPNFMPFLDLRGHVFNDGQLAGNVGIGERTVVSSINHVFGFYLYYDVRQEEHDLTVNQLSPGIEFLGKRMEYRVNAYFPVGEDESHSYQHKFKKFDGNRILLKSRKKYAMTGVDGEVGAHITQSTRHDFYFGIGPYYFTADPNNAWGGKTRLYWRYKDYISLEASYSYDHIFKNVVQGTVAFSYPFGTKLKREGRNCPNSNDLALSRAAFAPYRFEIPVVETHHRTNVGKNRATGQPFRVWFVNNTSSSDGTIESPFPTLAAAQNASGPNDIIYVFPGDGTTKGMNAGIMLQNGQMFFGSGTEQMIQTSKGSIKIPAMSANAPTITVGANSDVVTLANGNEVSGFVILQPGAANNGIAGNIGATVGINGMNIHDNVIQSAGGGVAAVAYGNIRVADNVITCPVAGASTIAITFPEQQFAQANILTNSLSGGATSIVLGPGAVGITTASASVLVAGNTVVNFSFEGIMVNSMPNSRFQILNNTWNVNANFTASSIIHAFCDSTVNAGTWVISGNQIDATTGLGSAIGLRVFNTLNTTASFFIANNNILLPNSGNMGIQVRTTAGQTNFCMAFTGNQVSYTSPTAGIGLNLVALGANASINVADLSGNIFPNITTSGEVNFIAPNSCSQ